MKSQKRFMKLLCLVLALTIFLPVIPAQASTDDTQKGYYASSVWDASYSVDKAFDNDLSTRWAAKAHASKGTEWICTMFDEYGVVDSVQMVENGHRIGAYEIQYYDENGTWTTCYTGTLNETCDTTSGAVTHPVISLGQSVNCKGIRFNVLGGSAASPGFFEFRMFYSGIQLKDGKLPEGYYASTTFKDENAVDKAFDDDPSTRWSACAEQGQWICAIFANEVTIDSVEINEFWDRMNSFEIQYLNENGIWQTCASKTVEGEDTRIDTTHVLFFDDVTTTGMRLYIHDAPGWPSIYEFKMFNDRPVPIEYVAQVGEQSYATVAEAIANANGGVVKMLVDSDEAITVSGDVTIDLAGNALSNVTVSAGKVQLIDTVGGGSANVTGVVETFTEADGKNYLVVGENGVYSAHEYSVTITHISLDPANDALGYKAKLIGDEVVQQAVTGIGFNLWVEEGNVKTYTTTGKQEVTLRLKNILANHGGEMNIHATAFVTFGEQTKTSQQQTTTMKQTLQMVNASWGVYNEAQKSAVTTLCYKYFDTVKSWELENILTPEVTTEEITVVDEPMTVYGGGTATLTLTDATTFTVHDSLDNSPYADWIADYYVSMSTQANEGLYLAGNYGSYGWIAIPVEAGQTYTAVPVVTTLLSTSLTYEEMVTQVGTFSCGVADSLGNNGGATVTVELRLTNPADPADYITLNVTEHTIPAVEETTSAA